jgi:hypothetical protein
MHVFASPETTRRGWSKPARILASLAILVHLGGVVLPPLAGPPPASLLANRLIQPWRPYVGLLFLGHGYRFFAPDPGPGHSIRWSLVDARGSIVEGTIPDAAGDWPRLLYHRRFMIPEKLSALVPPADAPDEIRREARLEWLPLVRAVAGELLSRHDGQTVSLQLVEHYLPSPADVIDAREGRPAAADTWQDLVTPLGTYARADAMAAVETDGATPNATAAMATGQGGATR